MTLLSSAFIQADIAQGACFVFVGVCCGDVSIVGGRRTYIAVALPFQSARESYPDQGPYTHIRHTDGYLAALRRIECSPAGEEGGGGGDDGQVCRDGCIDGCT